MFEIFYNKIVGVNNCCSWRVEADQLKPILFWSNVIMSICVIAVE